MEQTFLDWNFNLLNDGTNSLSPLMDLRAEVSQIKALPPLPQNACRLLQLSADPLADSHKLAAIIETDPLLTAQLVRWAGSSLYGYRGKIETAHDSISRVLGFDFVLNIALSLAALSSLRMPEQGPIGQRMFLLHGLASTQLMARLNKLMPVGERVPDSQLYLAGMLHNIGFPLLAHEFGDQFAFLEKLIAANPTLSVFHLESFTFNVEHSLLGGWLMQAWLMPDFIAKVVQHHHNPQYSGDYARLNQLVFLNDCLLGRLNIGDGQNEFCPEEVYRALSLSPHKCEEALEQMEAQIGELNLTVDQMLSA